MAKAIGSTHRQLLRLLSVDRTCRLQRRSLDALLGEAFTVQAPGDLIPAFA